MEKKSILIIILFLIFTKGVLALTANSTNYSVNMFGSGLSGSSQSSTNYKSISILETQPGTRNAESNSITSNIGFFENTPPHKTVSITSYLIYPELAVQGSIIKLSISALNYLSVWVILTPPEGSSETIALTNNENFYYTANLIGTYAVTFYANNSQGHLASIVDTFEITSPIVQPPVKASPSGGGTTKIIEKCNYIWDCSSWSICLEDKQKRTCKNIGNCTGTEGKPSELRKCSEALFDVMLRLDKVEVIENDILNLQVNLIETKGIEKIDVQIEYSVINNNNTKIFSQIETRAVEGNLSFEKELKELNLKKGDYTLRVDILYGNLQRAFAEEKINVKEKPLTDSNQRFNIFNLLKSFGLFILILIIFLLLIILRKKRSDPIEDSLGEGLNLIEHGKINEAKLKYENIEKIYKINGAANKKQYSRIIQFYNKIKSRR